MVNIFHMYT